MDLCSKKNRTEGDGFVDADIGAFRVKLRSELQHVTEDFAALYPAQPADGSDPQRSILIEVRRAGRSRIGRRLYRVYADGEEIGGWRTANGVFPLVEWGINLRVMATRSEYLQFHAASMAYRGQGFIFAGESGSGKSTLAAILLSRGWSYLCDEFALIDRKTACLLPFPKALCIKSGSFPMVRQLGLPFARRRDYIKELKGRVGYINPTEVGSAVIAQATPLRYIVFPRFRPGEPPRLHPLPKTQAVMDVFQHCFNRNAFADCGIPFMSKLVNQSHCYLLDVGDARKTGELLESLCPAPPTTAKPVVDRGSNPRASFASKDAAARLKSRREVLRLGIKLAYAVPTVVTLTGRQAMAGTSIPSGLCSSAIQTGGFCETDSDCCTGECDFGECR